MFIPPLWLHYSDASARSSSSMWVRAKIGASPWTSASATASKNISIFAIANASAWASISGIIRSSANARAR